MPVAAQTLKFNAVNTASVSIAQRQNSNKRGYGYRWQKYRVNFLKENPLCEHCHLQGLITAATDVDHIIPSTPDEKRFWAKKNHQGLCHSCHSRKTATEDGGFGNRKIKK